MSQGFQGELNWSLMRHVSLSDSFSQSELISERIIGTRQIILWSFSALSGVALYPSPTNPPSLPPSNSNAVAECFPTKTCVLGTNCVTQGPNLGVPDLGVPCSESFCGVQGARNDGRRVWKAPRSGGLAEIIAEKKILQIRRGRSPIEGQASLGLIGAQWRAPLKLFSIIQLWWSERVHGSTQLVPHDAGRRQSLGQLYTWSSMLLQS